jgi:hypothetical protein
MKTGRWYHVAIVRDGTSSFKMYLDGVLEATTSTDAGSINLNTYPLYWGVRVNPSGGAVDYPHYGYLAGSRVSSTAVYTGAFTPSLPTAISGTQLLLNHTNGGIVDLSTRNVIETLGDTKVNTAITKYGTGSLYFDGTGDYLKSNAMNANLNAFGRGDFTIELWVYFNAVNTQQVVSDFRDNASDTGGSLYLASNGSIRWYVQGSDRITGGAISASTWTHIAVCRSGTSTKLFINGTQSGSTYTDTFDYICNSGRPYLGALSDGTGTLYFNGYIDDFRITKGYARYTTTFTPPTGTFPRR